MEVCPSSNVQTRAASSWATHPVDFFVDYGLRVTINTDNRLMSDTTVTKELHLCQKHYGWSLQTIKEIIIAGFKSAFMPYREKADLLAEVSRELSKYEDPRGETTGRVGLVESGNPTSSKEAPPSPSSAKPKLQIS
jgi:adenosine deaminase